MGFQAVPEALRAASQSGRQAVSELRTADCGGPAADVAAALPGTQTAGAASSYARSWTASFTSWCDDAGQFVADLHQAAATYRTTDDQARDGLPTHGAI